MASSFSSSGDRIGILEIVEDSEIEQISNIYVTDKFIIKEIIDFDHFYFDDYYSEMLIETFVKKDGFIIGNLRNQTEKLIELAFKQNKYTIQCIKPKNLRYDFVKYALSLDGLLLEFIYYQNDELREIAISQNKEAIKYAKKYNTRSRSINKYKK